MPKSTFKAAEALRQGRYREVIDQLRPASDATASEQVALIGAHSFLGQLERALQIWQSFESSFNQNQKIEARFYLGVALTRISKFRKARSLFKTNLDEANSLATTAFAAQGAGFYLYFRGNFSGALKWSRKALQASVKSHETFIEYLSMDLLGHATVQSGRRSQGLKLMQEARQLALASKNANFSNAFAHARLIYEAEVGLRPQSILNELYEALDLSKLSDSYTRGNLVLELSRQLTLRGRFSEATNLLNREASSIYSFGNRRQEVMLQLRLAEISRRQGDFHFMLHLLQSAKKSINVLADKAFEIRLLGLYLKIPKEITGADHETAHKRLLEISGEHSSLIHRQILFRQGLTADPLTPAGEDPLHDLFLLAQSDLERAKNLSLELEYLSLYCEFSEIKLGTNFVQVLDTEGKLLIGTKDLIALHTSKLSIQQHRLLSLLAQGEMSKEKLIRQVWGYEYDPLRHDALIHNAIGKLRKSLSGAAKWVLTTEQGWRWDTQVKLIGLDQIPLEAASVIDDKKIAYLEFLNFRQLKALKALPASGAWSVPEYKKAFKVSTMTAFRDLAHLQHEGLMIRTGRGRACRYLLRKDLRI